MNIDGGVIKRYLSTFMQAMTSPKKIGPTRPFTVFVEGNIGSGKTSFLKHFSKSDVCVLSEPVELWRDVENHNLLGMMYDDPSRWSLTFQSYVQLTMLDLHTRRTSHPFKLMERSIFSARYCFVENLVRSGTMASAEFAVLDAWFSWITSTLDVGADLIVYLRTTPEVVHERIRSRARKEETCIPIEYLRDLHNLHEDWLYKNTRFSRPAPVLVLDADQDLDQMEAEIQKCKSIILQKDLIRIGKMCHERSAVSA